MDTPESPLGAALLGRTSELDEVDHVLDAVGALPAAVEIGGEAGIGKTTLWQSSIAGATARGYRCLRARPAEGEVDLAFTTLGDLFVDEFPAVAGALSESARRALGAALLVDDLATSAVEPRAIGVAVLAVVRALAANGPLLIAIDDVQWVDRASAGALGFALRRLANERVALIVARRTADAQAGAPAGGLTELHTRLPTHAIELSGLSLGALHAIVVGRFGRTLTRPMLRRLHELSRGNPFLAAELMRAASTGALALDEAGAVAPDLERLLGARLGMLPAPTRELLLFAAASSRPTFALLAAARGEGARRELRPALDAGIVEMAGDELQFSHPLLASIAYAAPDQERRAVHARLAELVADSDERARHLALAASGPDRAVAADVESAASTLFRRGAPAGAAQLAALASRLTPAEALADRRRRAAQQAEYLFAAGDTASAAAVVAGLLEDVRSANERSRLLALLARIRHFMDDLEQGNELNRQALVGLRGDDELRAGIHEGLAWGLLLTRADLRQAARHARSAVRAARRSGSDAVLAETLAARALTALATGQPVGRAMDQALRLEPAMLHLRVLRHPSYAQAYVLTCTDRLAEARAVYGELEARAEAHGDDSALPSIFVQLSMAELLAGAWAAAEEHAQAGLDLAEQTGQRPSQAALLSRLALLAAWRGRLAHAHSLAARALAHAGAADDSPAGIGRALRRGGEVAAWALGCAALAGDRPNDALRYLGPLADVLLGAGMREPGELRFLPDLVEAHLGAGQVDEALALVVELESMAAATRRPMARAIAQRCRAQVEDRRAEPAFALGAAEASVRLLAGGSLPLEEGRALLVLGTLQRRVRHRRDARQTLGSAVQRFEGLGADGWAARARAELARVGGRTASANLLTPAESRVAELVGTGLANKEIAAELGISTKTVELHLSHAYAKLGIGSRTELVRQLTLGNG